MECFRPTERNTIIRYLEYPYGRLAVKVCIIAVAVLTDLCAAVEELKDG